MGSCRIVFILRIWILCFIFVGKAIFVFLELTCRTHLNSSKMNDAQKLHVQNTPERIFTGKKKHLRQPGRPHPADWLSRTSRNVVFARRNRLTKLQQVSNNIAQIFPEAMYGTNSENQPFWQSNRKPVRASPSNATLQLACRCALMREMCSACGKAIDGLSQPKKCTLIHLIGAMG